MAIVAKLRYLRIAPRKVRLVADLIRGKSAKKAEAILNFTVKKAAKPLLKLLKSAIANAKNNFQLPEENLYVSKIFVDEGPKYKRWMPRARGLVSEIQKKTSHVTIVLDEIEKGPKKIEKVKAKKIAKKEKIAKIEKPKFRPEKEIKKPKIKKEVKRIFKRKAF
jgi:large subunit ribosomal protein L22